MSTDACNFRRRCPRTLATFSDDVHAVAMCAHCGNERQENTISEHFVPRTRCLVLDFAVYTITCT
eukprot:1062337-Rhodomonas_salina.1